MGLFSTLEISGSALAAERARAEIVAANMANAETTRTADGGPFRRKMAVFSGVGTSAFRLLLAGYNRLGGRPAGGVRLVQVAEDPAPPSMRYEPGHPDADGSGFVAYPNINPIQENGGPDGSGAELSAECVSGDCFEADDSAITGDLKVRSRVRQEVRE